MKCFYLLIGIFAVFGLKAQSTTGDFTYGNGAAVSWQDGTKWSSSPNYPGSGTDGDGTLNLNGETINFNHYMVLGSTTSNVDVDVATSNNAGGFNVNDVLVIYGDLTFANKSMPLNITGTLIIIGSLTINNQFTMTSSGTLVVSGLFDVQNDQQASYSGSGDVYAGSFSADAETVVNTGGGGESTFTIDELNDPVVGIPDQNFGTAIEEFVNGAGDIPLPIILEEFLLLNESNSVNIVWKTISEVNFSHFEIYKWKDEDFEIITSVPSTGRSDGDSYIFTDLKPHLGNNIYRLKSVDFDGYTEWFPAQSILFQPQDVEFRVYPNSSTSSELRTDIYDAFILEVFDLSGNKMVSERIEGKDLSSLQVLPAGNYIFRFTVNGHVVNQRVIIK